MKITTTKKNEKYKNKKIEKYNKNKPVSKISEQDFNKLLKFLNSIGATRYKTSFEKRERKNLHNSIKKWSKSLFYVGAFIYKGMYKKHKNTKRLPKRSIS